MTTNYKIPNEKQTPALDNPLDHLRLGFMAEQLAEIRRFCIYTEDAIYRENLEAVREHWEDIRKIGKAFSETLGEIK